MDLFTQLFFAARSETASYTDWQETCPKKVMAKILWLTSV